jgi:RNA-directed DNA polymerase
MDEGVLNHPETGVVQGGTISPVLANIFLQQVLDEWFEHEVQLRLKGRSFLIRNLRVAHTQNRPQHLSGL